MTVGVGGSDFATELASIRNRRDAVPPIGAAEHAARRVAVEHMDGCAQHWRAVLRERRREHRPFRIHELLEDLDDEQPARAEPASPCIGHGSLAVAHSRARRGQQQRMEHAQVL